jgi:hypothetical protein
MTATRTEDSPEEERVKVTITTLVYQVEQHPATVTHPPGGQFSGVCITIDIEAMRFLFR